jgi:hypothetical protein
MPAGPNAAERIMALLRRMGSTNGDHLGSAARWLWQALVREKLELGLPDAQTMSLTAVCDLTYRIDNPTPISLTVELVGDGYIGRGHYLEARPGSVTTRRAFRQFATLMYNGREIATVPASPEPCR